MIAYAKSLDFLQKETKRTKIFAAAEDKAFVSFVIFCLESSPVHPLCEKADKLSSEVIGAAIEVHRQKGPGPIESIYERCMLRELELCSIPATPKLESSLPSLPSVKEIEPMSYFPSPIFFSSATKRG